MSNGFRINLSNYAYHIGLICFLTFNRKISVENEDTSPQSLLLIEEGTIEWDRKVVSGLWALVLMMVVDLKLIDNIKQISINE